MKMEVERVAAIIEIECEGCDGRVVVGAYEEDGELVYCGGLCEECRRHLDKRCLGEKD